MIPLKLDGATGFVQAHGDELHVGFTSTGKFYNLAVAFFDVKIHVFEVLQGDCDASLSCLAKAILERTNCKRIYLQTGAREVSTTYYNNVLQALCSVLEAK